MRNKIAGIYSLTNKTTGKRYIGQTVYLNGRKGDHLLNLRRNQHNNDYLQKAFNKYGEEDFIFEVLEVVPKLENGANDKHKLTEREQYWMDYYKSWDRDHGYNINPSASINPMQGKTHTPEAREKIRQAALGRVLSEDNKQKLHDSRRNKPSNSRDKQEKKEAKYEVSRPGKIHSEYHVKTPEGVEHIFTNLSEFCALNNLSRTHLAAMINKGKYYKGWTGYKIDITNTNENINIVVSNRALKGKEFEYTLLDRNNKAYIFRNLSVFSKDNKISSTTLTDLLNNKIEYRGWKLSRITLDKS